ncbi:MAG TPA: cyclase family protein [Steroidobacteraceae bacterium]|nr:cyclase family protein [Steroidobacteraceae bacterium]
MDAAPATAADLDFAAATPLALQLDFTAPHPRHFGAPAAEMQPLRLGDFEGEVVRGASCNCSRITLVPHCNGTHTESVSHLTVQQVPLQDFVPLAPLPALLLTVAPVSAASSPEDSDPGPQPHDELVTRQSVLDAWLPFAQDRARALLLRTGAATGTGNPPYLSRQLVQELVTRGVEHLVVDLPSVDRAHDEGRLTAHRIFFGLPPHSVDRAQATRAHCTITELAHFPATLADGPCALQLQLAPFTGDAVPSRPLHIPLVRRSCS